MKLGTRFVVLFFLLFSAVTHAQSATPNDPCGAMPAGAKDFFGFAQFDSELRDDLRRRDATALAFLVAFPLRVNRSDGTILLNDAEALRTRFDEIFSSATIKSILETDASAFGCNAEGIGYGRGDIWVNASPRGYAIWSVNPESSNPVKERKIKQLYYVCQATGFRIVIDEVSGDLRYRSWNRPHLVSAKPDLQLSHGKQTFEGTNVCAVPVYTFVSGSTEYRIGAGLGCDYAMAEGATGDLEVTSGGKTVLHTACF